VQGGSGEERKTGTVMESSSLSEVEGLDAWRGVWVAWAVILAITPVKSIKRVIFKEGIICSP
jgi:hypothetical protein